MTIKVDVVIPTRNRSHRLLRVVEPLLEDASVNRLVVVNDAADGTVQSLRALLPERVEIICAGGVGPAQARQAGAAICDAEVLLFVDDDVVPERRLATRHARYHEHGGRLLVCGYTPIVTTNGALSAEASVYGDSYERRCEQYDLAGVNVLTHLWGGNFSLRRSDAVAVGLSSADFTEPWHEDRDFGLRCLEAGLEAIFDRGTRANHEYERAWSEVARESYRRGYSLAVLHHLHQPLIGSIDERCFEQGRSLPLRLAVRLLSRRPWNRPALGGLHLLRWLGGRLGLRGLELKSVRMLRLIQNTAGARDALEALG